MRLDEDIIFLVVLSFSFKFLEAITSLMLSKQNYFLVDCLMSFGKAPGRNLFRAARPFQTYYMSVKFRIKLCHGYDFLCLN